VVGVHIHNMGLSQKDSFKPLPLLQYIA
jgi:hypothetical protein